MKHSLIVLLVVIAVAACLVALRARPAGPGPVPAARRPIDEPSPAAPGASMAVEAPGIAPAVTPAAVRRRSSNGPRHFAHPAPNIRSVPAARRRA